ncbi:MAG: TolC family protein, partial [Chitinophagaceae bacterium]
MKLPITNKTGIEKILASTAFYLLLSLVSLAQKEARFISLNEAIETVVSRNNAVQSAKIEEAIAQEKHKQTDAAFLPQVNFSFAALTTNNPLNVFGFKLQQRNVTMNDFEPKTLNDPSRAVDFTTKIEVQQPLLNLDAVYMKKGALAQLESHRFKTFRTKEFLTLETQKAYFQLQLAHEAITVLEEALATARSVYEFTNNRVAQGLIQRSDLLNVEVQVLGIESNLNEARSNLRNASDYLAVLMNKPTGEVYQTEQMKQADSPGSDIQNLPQNRSDFLALEKAMNATSLMEKANKMKLMPRLNAFGSYQWNDKALTGFGADSYIAGLQLTWNLFDGNNTKRQAAAFRLERQKLDLQLRTMHQENQMMLDKANRDLADSEFKIKKQKA